MMLYIDPGTGSMLFAILIGIFGAGFYSLRLFLMKMKYKISGSHTELIEKKIPYVIFSDDKRYFKVFEPVIREMSKRGKEVMYLTGSEDDPAFESDIEGLKAECIGKSMQGFYKLNLLKASILLSTTPGLEVYQWKRSKTVDYYVHIPHAASEITLYRMFGIDYYDAILLSGEYQVQDVRRLEQLRELPEKELVKVGIPYMDEMAKRLAECGPAPAHPRTVLLAPSWGPSALFSVYGERILEVLVETGYHIIVRPHPQSFTAEAELLERLMEKYPASEQIEWNRDTDNFDVLHRSDILISDFSGVIFDFTLIFDKPVIYTDPSFDVSPYDAWWLETPLWTTSALPRLGCELTQENFACLRELIDTCLTDPKYQQGRNEVKNETWEHPNEGATRVADYLIAKYEELNPEEKGEDQ